MNQALPRPHNRVTKCVVLCLTDVCYYGFNILSTPEKNFLDSWNSVYQLCFLLWELLERLTVRKKKLPSLWDCTSEMCSQFSGDRNNFSILKTSITFLNHRPSWGHLLHPFVSSPRLDFPTSNFFFYIVSQLLPLHCITSKRSLFLSLDIKLFALHTLSSLSPLLHHKWLPMSLFRPSLLKIPS